MKKDKFNSFQEFYPFYLSEHKNLTNRSLHFVGTSLSLVNIFLALQTGNLIFMLIGILFGYGFAWVGHFFFEKNKPASFNYPVWSFMGDWVMYK